MGFRRKKSEVMSDRRWREFLIENQRLIEQSGLPENTMETKERFYDFLEHGHLDHHDDPSRFIVDHLDDERFCKCMELIERSIEAGFVRREEQSSINQTMKRSFRPS